MKSEDYVQLSRLFSYGFSNDPQRKMWMKVWERNKCHLFFQSTIYFLFLWYTVYNC